MPTVDTETISTQMLLSYQSQNQYCNIEISRASLNSFRIGLLEMS